MTGRDVTRLRVTAFGVVVPIEVRGAALGEAVAEAWRDALTEAEPTTDAVVTDGLDVAAALHHLSPAVTVRAIDARAGELVMLHAAALADPDSGRTAVLVAASGTGKTTASRTLGKRFSYLSDETAAIAPDGTVLPYRKPLSIIESGPLKTQVAPSSLGLLTTDRECRLAAVLVLERAPDHVGPPTLTPMETVDAIAAIAPQSSYLPTTPPPLHRLADLLHLAGGAHHVTYAEAADLEDVLARLLGAEA
jgi:hypothetical protein